MSGECDSPRRRSTCSSCRERTCEQQHGAGPRGGLERRPRRAAAFRRAQPDGSPLPPSAVSTAPTRSPGERERKCSYEGMGFVADLVTRRQALSRFGGGSPAPMGVDDVLYIIDPMRGRPSFTGGDALTHYYGPEQGRQFFTRVTPRYMIRDACMRVLSLPSCAALCICACTRRHERGSREGSRICVSLSPPCGSPSRVASRAERGRVHFTQARWPSAPVCVHSGVGAKRRGRTSERRSERDSTRARERAGGSTRGRERGVLHEVLVQAPPCPFRS